MLQQKKPEDFVVATGTSHSLEDFTRMVFESCRLRWEEHIIQDPESFRPTDLEVSLADPSKARRDLGWSCQVSLPRLVEKLLKKELF